MTNYRENIWVKTIGGDEIRPLARVWFDLETVESDAVRKSELNEARGEWVRVIPGTVSIEMMIADSSAYGEEKYVSAIQADADAVAERLNNLPENAVFWKLRHVNGHLMQTNMGHVYVLGGK